MSDTVKVERVNSKRNMPIWKRVRYWIAGWMIDVRYDLRRYILKKKIARAKKQGGTTARMIIELEIAGLFGKDGDFYGGMTGYAVAELLLKFEEAGHSGMSASLTAQIFHSLIKGEVLSPLKGTPDEWSDRSEFHGRPCFQNKRNYAVFATGPNGEGAYFADGKVFRDKDGHGYTNKNSRVPLTFPCIPKTEYVETGE